MAVGSIYDVREDKIDIEDRPWNDSLVQQLAWKNIYIVQKMVEYWNPDLLRGQYLYDMYDGRILTDEQRDIYEQIEDKIVIEPPIAKAAIRSLLGHSIQARKSGTIEVEDGDIENPNNRVNEIETVDICIKHMEKKSKEAIKVRDAIHDSMVTCYPNYLIYEKRRPTGDNPLKYSLEHLAWNSCVFGPTNTYQPDMSDIRELAYFRNYSMSQLIELYPHMEEYIIAHWSSSKLDDKQLSSLMHWDDSKNAKDISWLNNIYSAAFGSLSNPNGTIPTFMRLFPIKRKEEVWIPTSFEDEQEEVAEHVVIPPEWSKKRKSEWIERNKDKYSGPYEKPIVTLWQCVFTATGLMLSNKKHWYQNYGNLPGVVIVPALLNGKSTGPMVDMSPEVLRNCIAQIEYLDDLRKGNGQILVTKEGALTKDSVENIHAEANKSLGVLLLKSDYAGSASDAVHFEKRVPSTAWRDYGEYQKQEMTEITRINEAMQGESAPRQSAVAKQNEISQALVVSALYFDNFNLQWENLQNLKLSVFQLNYDGENISVEAYIDNQKTVKSQVLNVPQYDISGEKTGVLNDITSNRYKWMVSPVDDSPTAKARNMQDAILIINGSAGPLQKADPSSHLLASFWSALDNPIINQAGKKLMQDAQIKQESMTEMQKQQVMQEAQTAMLKAMADMEKARKTGVSVSFTGEQFAQYPQLSQFYQSLISQNGQQAPQPPQSGAINTQQPTGIDQQGSGVPEDLMPASAVQSPQ